MNRNVARKCLKNRASKDSTLAKSTKNIARKCKTHRPESNYMFTNIDRRVLYEKML